MQERFFPVVMFLVNGEFQQFASFGMGQPTPELAHKEGLEIDTKPTVNPFKKNELVSKQYQNRVQTLWVPVQ